MRSMLLSVKIVAPAVCVEPDFFDRFNKPIQGWTEGIVEWRWFQSFTFWWHFFSDVRLAITCESSVGIWPRKVLIRWTNVRGIACWAIDNFLFCVGVNWLSIWLSNRLSTTSLFSSWLSWWHISSQPSKAFSCWHNKERVDHKLFDRSHMIERRTALLLHSFYWFLWKFNAADCLSHFKKRRCVGSELMKFRIWKFLLDRRVLVKNMPWPSKDKRLVVAKWNLSKKAFNHVR